MNYHQRLIRKMIKTDVPDHWIIYYHGNGFQVRKMDGHPLASKHGTVMLHRLMMFEFLGRPGSSTCTVCGFDTPWSPGPSIDSIKVVAKGDKHSCDLDDFELVCGWCQANRTKLGSAFFDLAQPYFGVPQNDRPNLFEHTSKHG